MVKKAKRITATESIIRTNRKLEAQNEMLVQTLRLAKHVIVWLAANRKGNLTPPQPDIVEQIDKVLSASDANGYVGMSETMCLTGATRDPDFSDEPRG